MNDGFFISHLVDCCDILKMQLDVDIEPTFRFTYIKCIDKPDMGTKLLRLHEAEAFEAKASASASWFRKPKASALASASAS